MSEPRKKQSEFVKWMGPLLDGLRAFGGSAKPREVSAWIAESQKVSVQKRQETLKSGEERFHNQVAWARQYLVWEGLLDGSRRGVWTLTDKGWKIHLTEQQGREIFKRWVAFHAQARRAVAPKADTEVTTLIEGGIAWCDWSREPLNRETKKAEKCRSSLRSGLGTVPFANLLQITLFLALVPGLHCA